MYVIQLIGAGGVRNSFSTMYLDLTTCSTLSHLMSLHVIATCL